MLKKILTTLLVLLLLAQFIRPAHNEGEAAGDNDITHTVTVPDTVMSLLKTACYDCHSNHTKYPWYSKITPINWWLYNHIQGGKRHLNFSEFNTSSFKRKAKRLEEVGETVEKHEMPIASYLWIHNDAKLTDAQRKIIMDWAKSAEQRVMQDSMRSRRVLDSTAAM